MFEYVIRKNKEEAANLNNRLAFFCVMVPFVAVIVLAGYLSQGNRRKAFQSLILFVGNLAWVFGMVFLGTVRFTNFRDATWSNWVQFGAAFSLLCGPFFIWLLWLRLLRGLAWPAARPGR
jgi:cytochrome c biogenesis protein CcdA